VWDENPGRVRLAGDIARAITEQVALTPDMSVVDFGCGTGLLAIQLRPHVGSITGVDSSQGMLDVFRSKIAELGLSDVDTMLVDLDADDTLTGSYDLVFSSMTLHHVSQVEPLLGQFFGVTAPGGHLCIADLDSDDGQFHEDATGVFHSGFDRQALRAMFEAAGFEEVRDTTAAAMDKPTSDGGVRRFTVFLMTGRRGT
jgi:ubiquinone/menaquinone biosynthesis C-methylase UbiE